MRLAGLMWELSEGGCQTAITRGRVAQSGDGVWFPRRGTRRMHKRDCDNEVAGARPSAPQD